MEKANLKDETTNSTNTVLNDGWQIELPTKCVTALCEGNAYDGCYFGEKKYFIAEYMAHWPDPKWIYGKQQNECEVTRWKLLSACI